MAAPSESQRRFQAMCEEHERILKLRELFRNFSGDELRQREQEERSKYNTAAVSEPLLAFFGHPRSLAEQVALPTALEQAIESGEVRVVEDESDTKQKNPHPKKKTE